MKTAHLILWLIVLVGAALTRADSWLPPGVQVIASPDGNTIARIQPGERRGEGIAPVATLFKFNQGTGEYERAGAFPLRNRLAPVEAVISNEGEFLVTFDDWGQVGRTRQTVAVYRGATGELVKAWALEDIVSDTERQAFTTTKSSTWWRGRVQLNQSGHEPPRVTIAVSGTAAGKDDRPASTWLQLDLATLTFERD